MLEFIQGQNLQLAAVIFAGIGLAVFIILSIVLNYHWRRYGVSHQEISRLRRIYFSVAAVFLAVMFAAIFFIV
jgi:hypothetical protein